MFEHLVEAEFLSRPEDDDLAFLHFERLFRGPLDAALATLQDRDHDSYWDSYHHFMQTYINQVLAAANQLDIESESLKYWINSPSAANERSNHQQIKFDIDAAITGIKVRYSSTFRKNSVHLTAEAREKIRDLVNKIKLTIEGVELPLMRKEALMGKLNAFCGRSG